MALRHMKTLFDELGSRFLQCSTCHKPFDDKKRVPRFLPCMHTVCEDCLNHQLMKNVNDERTILCSLCCTVFPAPSPDVSIYEKNNTLRDLKDFVSDKQKKELCNECTNQFSAAYCTECDLSLCISCNETIHIDNNSSHNVKFLVEKQNPSFDACHMCNRESNIFCPICKMFLCYTCGDFHHSKTSVGTHTVFKVNENNDMGVEMDDSSLHAIGKTRMEASPMNIFLDDLSSQFLECFVCRNPFNDSAHVPVFYLCMHTTCKDCHDHSVRKFSDGTMQLRCPWCRREYIEHNLTVSNYKENAIIKDLNSYVLTKKKNGFCDHCPIQLSNVYCLECDSNLCVSCNETIHAGDNSFHNVITGVKKQDLPKNTCCKCLKQSLNYCETCKIFLCNKCKDTYHSNESFVTHNFLRMDESNRIKDLLLPMAKAVAVFGGIILVVVALLGYPSAPAYISVPSDEVEPVHMLCRHQTKMEEYPYMAETKKRSVRTLCTFNVFHYDLRNRRRTYFVIDIDIDISETYKKSRLGKLFTIKTIPDKIQDTPNIYWTVYRCETMAHTMALCLNKRDYPGLARLISRVSIGETKLVSFLFLVDNDKKVMEIFSPAVLWSDKVSLDNYNNEDQPLSIWILLAESKHDKYINARIRSGADVTIHDLSKTEIEITLDYLVYPFTYLYRFLKEKLPPSGTQVEL